MWGSPMRRVLLPTTLIALLRTVAHGWREQAVGDEGYRFRGKVEAMDCRVETFDYRTPPSDFLSLLGLERDRVGHRGRPRQAAAGKICG